MGRAMPEQHQQIDPVFKQTLIDELALLPATLQTEVEVSRLPRTIDAIIMIEDEESRQTVRTNTPFFYLLRHNQIEFKGRRDRLTVPGYHLIRGRTHLYMGEQKINPEEMTVTIICAGKPRAVMKYVQRLQQPFIALEPGYYRRQGQPSIHLIVINELSVTPKNYSLLLFAASEDKFREFLEQVVAQRDRVYIRYAYEVRPRVTKEMLTMAGISATLSREDLAFMADDIGRELMAFLPLEERLAGASAEELLTVLTPEKRKRLLELMLKMSMSTAVEKHESNGNSSS